MDNQVQTIVCPNCGASVTNRHNCEYCGSFLVQRAAEGVDVTEYINCASKYSIEGLEEALKVYRDIMIEHPEENALYFEAYGMNNLEPNTGLGSSVPHTGLSLSVTFTPEMVNDGLLLVFQNSAVYSVFQKSEKKAVKINASGQRYETDAWVIDFGYDIKGAAKVLSQLYSIYEVDENRMYYRIIDASIHTIPELFPGDQFIKRVENLGLPSTAAPDFVKECVVFNKRGAILEDSVGLQKSGYQSIVDRRNRYKEDIDFVKKGKHASKGCFGMLAFLLAAGIGSIYGVVELIKTILT